MFAYMLPGNQDSEYPKGKSHDEVEINVCLRHVESNISLAPILIQPSHSDLSITKLGIDKAKLGEICARGTQSMC